MFESASFLAFAIKGRQRLPTRPCALPGARVGARLFAPTHSHNGLTLWGLLETEKLHQPKAVLRRQGCRCLWVCPDSKSNAGLDGVRRWLAWPGLREASVWPHVGSDVKLLNAGIDAARVAEQMPGERLDTVRNFSF